MFEAYRERFGLNDPLYVQYFDLSKKYAPPRLRLFPVGLSRDRVGDYPTFDRLDAWPGYHLDCHHLCVGCHGGRVIGVEAHAESGEVVYSVYDDLCGAALLSVGAFAAYLGWPIPRRSSP